MKLIIQIPCYNEEKTLPLVLKELPKKIEGIDIIEYQIINDGSTDKTVEVAKKYGVHHIVEYVGNKGLGVAFKTGIEHALMQGADIVVNTDGDNQYPSKYIPDLVKPIVDEQADIVISDRQTAKIKHFSSVKKWLQWLGSAMVRVLSGTDVPDTVSGFRAYSRESLLQLNVTSRFSYVLDTIIQAGKKGLKIKAVKITTNPPTRKSRLFKNIWQHIKKSTADMLRIYTMYEPLKVFSLMAFPFVLVWSGFVFRFLYLYLIEDIGSGRIQSLVLSGVLINIGFVLFAMGVIGDMIAKNRKLIEDNLYLEKKERFSQRKIKSE